MQTTSRQHDCRIDTDCMNFTGLMLNCCYYELIESLFYMHIITV